MTAWGDIIESAARFEPVAREHGLHLVTNLRPGVGEGRPRLQVEVHDVALELQMLHVVPVADGAAWIDALCSLLDVPTEELPHPDRWAPITDEYLEHRLALEDLPLVDDPRGG